VVGFGCLGVIFYFIFLCCRSGCACCRKEAACGPNLSRFILFIMIIAMMVLTMCSYVGYGHFIEGMNGVAGNLGHIKKTITTLDNGAGDMYTYGVRFVENSERVTTSCAVFTDTDSLERNSVIFKGHSEVYSTALPDPSVMSTLIGLFENELQDYVKILLGFAAAVSATTCLFSVMGILCKSSALLNLSSLLSIFLILLFIALIGIELTLSVLFADFCYAGPNDSIQDMSDKIFPEEAANVVSFYMTCTGTNPLEIHLNKTINALAVIGNETDYFYERFDCTAGAMATLHSTVALAEDTTSEMSDKQSCATINDHYFNMVDEALCNKTISGLFELWATHLAAAAMLYACMFFTSHVKQKCKVTPPASCWPQQHSSPSPPVLSLFSPRTSSIRVPFLGSKVDGRGRRGEGHPPWPSSRSPLGVRPPRTGSAGFVGELAC